MSGLAIVLLTRVLLPKLSVLIKALKPAEATTGSTGELVVTAASTCGEGLLLGTYHIKHFIKCEAMCQPDRASTVLTGSHIFG